MPVFSFTVTHPTLIEQRKIIMYQRVWLLPFSVFALVVCTFIISYTIAVTQGHVLAIFPFISDTGALPPESCIFGQLTNIASVLMAMNVYVRHRQIVEFYGRARKSHRCFILCSNIAMWVGFLASLGTSFVANFQENRWILMHIIGAMMAFGLGILYCWFQTIFSYIIKPVLAGRWVCHIRLVLSLLATGFFIASFLFFLLFTFVTCVSLANMSGYLDRLMDHSSSTNSTNSTTINPLSTTTMSLPLNVHPGDPDYYGHLVSALSEWLMVLNFMLYFLTFVVELRHASIIPSKLILDIDEQDFPRSPGEENHVNFRSSTPRSNGASLN